MMTKSYPYSFRLSDDKPDEAQAIKILKLWKDAGYDVRATVTRALIELHNVKPVGTQYVGEHTEEIKLTLSEIQNTLQQLVREGRVTIQTSDNQASSESQVTIDSDDSIIQSFAKRKRRKK